MPDKWGDSIPDIPEIPDDLQLADVNPARPSFDERYIDKDTVGQMNVDAEDVIVKMDSIGDPVADGQPEDSDGFAPADISPILSAIYSELKLISSILNEMR